MSSRLKNGLLIASLAVLTLFPLLSFKPSANPTARGTEERFEGSDSRAASLVQSIAPDYKPWFQSVTKQPERETERLLFALQAAVGAGFVGYYVVSTSRRKMKQRTGQNSHRDN